MTRIMKALAAKREQLAKKDEGFTLIELLVVVIIIGILAAIAIPVYIGVQDSAKDSAVASDLGNAKTAVVTYFTQNGTEPADLDNLKDQGYPGPSLEYAAGAAPAFNANTDNADGAFCIVATSTSTSTPQFYVNESSGVVKVEGTVSLCD
jgi:prepilin-type N-terminal cleavage/methylation domain-containing protein